MPNYSQKVIENFTNPKNVGEMPDADAIGEAGSAHCGDTTTVYLKIEEGIIKDITFKTYGCAAAIASSSMLTEMVKGMTVEEAMKVTKQDIVDALDGMPAPKVHCSLLAEDALKAALHEYLKKELEK